MSESAEQPTELSDLREQVQKLTEERRWLHGIIKVLCSDPSPMGSSSFRKARSVLKPDARNMLFEVLRSSPSEF